MFSKVLVANRGEIALRVIRACRDLGVLSVAVHSTADAGAAFVRLADEAVEIGPADAAQSYLSAERIIEASRKTGAEAIHPGYGFLSENADFAAACAEAGLVFVGPPPEAIAAMGDKVAARRLMSEAGVPVVPGSGPVDDVEAAVTAARTVGYPLFLKASAGGGGVGMRLIGDESELRREFEALQGVAGRIFKDRTLFVERYLARARHIEVQLLADSRGGAVHLGERECSVQRRRQKLIEESPSPALDPASEERMGKTALEAARSVGYRGAGTVEFVYADGEFFFIEMNTRLQVEHPVTEMVTGLDLVVEQLRIAAGEPLSVGQDEIVRSGHAVECRVYAEDYLESFRPSPGRVTAYREPAGPGVRVDSALRGPGPVPAEYDPMVAKVITWGRDREQACARMRRALSEYVISGVRNNIPYHLAVLSEAEFLAGDYSTAYVEEHPDLVEEASRWEERRQGFLGAVLDPARVAAIAAALSMHAPSS